MGKLTLCALAICIGACASSGSETTNPQAMAASAEPAAAAEGTSPVAAGEIHDIEAPEVQQTAGNSQPNDPDEVICRKERETGSRFVARVCRTRAEMEREAEIAKESAMQMRTGSGSDCALNLNC